VEKLIDLTGDANEAAWLWLCSIPEISCRQQRILVSYFGSPMAVFMARDDEFDAWERIGRQWVRNVRAHKNDHFADGTAEKMKRKGVRFISCEHSAYPARLRSIADAPCGLFFKGRLPDDQMSAAAVIGSRNCSSYGAVMAGKIAGVLADCGIPVISGMARGIDGISQRECLDNGGVSFGVLGSGADVCYPRENIELYEMLAEKGGILSEYPCGTQPLAWHFPARNRIICGLAEHVIVVEAREDSGSLITVSFALEQGRNVIAVPGRSGDVLSTGCNQLIRDGAQILLSEDELPSLLGLPAEEAERRRERKMQEKSAQISAEERQVLAELSSDPVSFDILLGKLRIRSGQLSGILLKLQMDGYIREISKNLYIKY
jgi:DNA processing protein